MAITQPTVNSKNLPYPSDYAEEVYYKASVRRMASGALVRDIVTSSNHLKLRFSLTWQNVNSTDRALVTTVLGDLYDGTSRTYKSPNNTTYTVVLAEGGEPKWQAVESAGALRYSGTLVLEEV